MSQNCETSSVSNYQLIFDNALATYEKKTGKNLASDPLLRRLESCRSPNAVLAILREQIPGFDQSGSNNDRFSDWLNPTVRVLYTFSSAIGEAFSLAYPPVGIIFTGIASLLSAVQGVSSGQDALFDLFDKIENFFQRLETYIELPQTAGMMDIIVKVMVNVLLILALATKELRQSKIKRFLRKQVGRSDVEGALRRLEMLTQEEHRMATVRDLRTTHRVEERVMNVENALQRLEMPAQRERWMEAAQDLGAMHCVDVRVETIEYDEQARSIDEGVQGVDERVQCVDERLQGIDERVKNVDDKIDVVIDGIEQIKELRQGTVDASGQKRKQLQQDLARWLSPSDPFVNYNTTSGTRHKDTAMWFIQGDTFKGWKESTSLLWIYGKPGAGKSVLTSAIIQDINVIRNAGPESAHIAFFFFDFKDIGKQDARALLSSFIVQLNNQSNSFYDILLRFYTTHHNGTQQPSIDALTRCFENIIRAFRAIPIYLIIDALDECPNTTGLFSQRDHVLSLVEKLVTLSLPRLHLCITSRPEIDIRTAIEPITLPSNRISLHNQSGQKKDINDFVRAVVYSDKNMRRWRGEDKELVIRTLSERADGMFRWAFCQLEVLRQCFPSSVRRILTELPESLDETYERILQQIPKSNQMHAHRLLQCLTVAARPLRVNELAEVLAIDFSATRGTLKVNENLRWEDQEQAVLFTCSSLVTIVDDAERWPLVQFSHFSVKEFLTSDRLAASMTFRHHHIHLEPAHTIMAQACLSALLHIDRTICETICAYIIKEYPLAQYAGEHFGEHVEFGNVLSYITDGVDDLFNSHKPHFYMWLWLLLNYRGHSIDPENHYRSSINWRPKPSPFTTWPPPIAPLHIVALCGYLCLARHLISKRPQDLHARDGGYRTPLHIAVLAGREEISLLFMKYSVDLDMRDPEKQTLLHMAAYKGLTEVALTYLRRRWAIKALVNARNKDGRAALHIASRHRHPTMVALLLEFGARVDAKDNDNNTPLHLATWLLDYRQDTAGIYETVQLLLEHGATVHVRDENGQTPLHLACQYKLFRVVPLLFKFGARVDVKDNYDNTPLHLAVRLRDFGANAAGVHETIQLLLGHGASVHAREKNGQTPLHLACLYKLSHVVPLLLKFGARVDVKDNNHNTPLLLAVRIGDFRADTAGIHKNVQLLLQHGASVHAREKNGQTPLHLASQHSLSNVVALLLELGAEVDVLDDNDITPLFGISGSQRSHSPFASSDATAGLLLEHGARVYLLDWNGRTPLHLAAQRNFPGIVALLLKFGAEVDALDNDQMTPLFLADSETGPLLLKHGASVHLRDKCGQTPLHTASRNCVPNLVASLLDSGADMNAQDQCRRSPLHSALSLWQHSWKRTAELQEVIELLLDYGASVYLQDDSGRTPLQIGLLMDQSVHAPVGIAIAPIFRSRNFPNSHAS